MRETSRFARALLGAHPDRELAIARYDSLAPHYDSACRRIDHLRAMAIDALDLRPGDIVYDVACGTGAALPELRRRVGSTGRVVAIEQCAAMARQAAARFEGNALPANVSVIVASVEDAVLDVQADAMLFCYTHDVLQSRQALDRLRLRAKPAARFAALGLRLLPWWWGAPVNLWKLWSGRHYVTTWRGLRAPWTLLEEGASEFRFMGHYHLGTNYLATGRFRGKPDPLGEFEGSDPRPMEAELRKWRAS